MTKEELLEKLKHTEDEEPLILVYVEKGFGWKKDTHIELEGVYSTSGGRATIVAFKKEE